MGYRNFRSFIIWRNFSFLSSWEWKELRLHNILFLYYGRIKWWRACSLKVPSGADHNSYYHLPLQLTLSHYVITICLQGQGCSVAVTNTFYTFTFFLSLSIILNFYSIFSKEKKIRGELAFYLCNVIYCFHNYTRIIYKYFSFGT